MDDTSDREAILANLIKQACDYKGRWYVENRDAGLQTSKYFRELGLLYMHKGGVDKFCYIYSAGLLAAASVRDPSNYEAISAEMQVLWESALKMSQAANPSSKIATISETIKTLVGNMRENASALLDRIPQVTERQFSDTKTLQEENKITAIRDMLIYVTNEYISIMNKISSHCVSTLFGSKPPCKFAHVALGSVAREEATVFSDFENIILLDDECVLDDRIIEQFRWYAVLFQIVLITLGESPIRLLGIPALNDFSVNDKSKDWFFDAITKSGMQFDSNMAFAAFHPLGHKASRDYPASTEWIKPVSEMASWLQKCRPTEIGHTGKHVENLKHLESVLEKSRFVAGCEELHKQYRLKIQEILEESPQRFIPQIASTMATFDSLNVLSEHNNTARLKELMYRSASLLISYMGSMLNIPNPNCFIIIESLVKKGVFSPEAGRNLMYATAVAGEVRMKVYHEEGQQVAEVKMLPVTDDHGNMSQIIRSVGEISILDFFDIIRCLWIYLHPVIWGKKKIDEDGCLLCPMRGGSKTAMLTVYASLHLLTDKPIFDRSIRQEVLVNDPHAPELQDSAPFAKLAVQKLIKVFKDMLKMISHYEQVYKIETNPAYDSSVVKKCSEMMKALKSCKESFSERNNAAYISSPARITRCFFPRGFASLQLDKYIDSVQSLQTLIRHHFEDECVVGVLPDMIHLIYRIGDFTRTLRQFNQEKLSCMLAGTTDASGMFVQFDHVCVAMRQFKQDLNSFSYKPSRVNAPEFILEKVRDAFDDGFFAIKDLTKGMGRWEERVDITRAQLLKLDKFRKAIEDKNAVIMVMLSVLDWSFILSFYREVLARDAELVIADVTCIKATYYYTARNYVDAKTLFSEALRIYRECHRTKHYHRIKVAEVMKSIAQCMLALNDYDPALSLFRDELTYRFEHLLKRTSMHTLAGNLDCQAMCLEGLFEPAAAKEYASCAQLVRSGLLK